jgi:hypothetical protein
MYWATHEYSAMFWATYKYNVMYWATQQVLTTAVCTRACVIMVRAGCTVLA